MELAVTRSGAKNSWSTMKGVQSTWSRPSFQRSSMNRCCQRLYVMKRSMALCTPSQSRKTIFFGSEMTWTIIKWRGRAAGCELEERGQGQANLFSIRDNRPIVLADLPTCVRENQIGTTEPLEHPARSARDRSRRGVVENVGIEASRKLQVVGPGALAARYLFADVGSNDADTVNTTRLLIPLGLVHYQAYCSLKFDGQL